MEYRLTCTGRLLDGVDRNQALPLIARALGLTEAQVEREILTGTSGALVAATNREKLERLHAAFRKAGLDVGLEAVTEASDGSPSTYAPVEPEATPARSFRQDHRFGLKWWVLAPALVILLSAAGVAGYAWHWLNRPMPPEIHAAEDALFDGSLVAIGLVDVEKLVALKTYWFGDVDPNQLPVAEEKKGLLQELFTGPAQFKANLRQVVFSLHVQPAEEQVHQVMLLSGRFDADALLETLGRSYQLEKVDDDRWVATEREMPQLQPVCPKDEPRDKPSTLYLQISPEWVMVFDVPSYGDEIWTRLQSRLAPSQALDQWRRYRQGRLAGFMAMAPVRAGKAIGGMPGMMAQGAASDAPQVTGVAAGIRLEPLQGGLNANLRFASEDEAWNRETEADIRRELDRMTQDSRTVSPTLAGLFSRVTVAGGTDALEIDVQLDTQLLNDLGDVVREGVASLFQVSVTGGGDGGTVPREIIDENPQQYANLDLSELPPFRDKFRSEPPLFSRGAFAVDFNSIQPNDAGLLEIWLEGKVGLPEHTDQRFNNIGVLAMSVASVQDAAGNELLRDERCLDRNDLSGRSPNHEEETNANHNQDHGWVWKHVRLIPGVSVEQIDRIKGKLSFSMPTHVRRFEVPLRAGEAVEHAGMRFYLGSIKPDAVSYQVSGATERLLEVRGLNEKGQVLRRGWQMSVMDDGRFTQSYEGEVQALEIYVAEDYLQRETEFQLTDLFRPPEENGDDNSPQWLAPERIDPSHWHDYAALDLARLAVDPKKDWHLWDKDVTPIADGSWAPLRMFVTHTPKAWGNDPQAHIYFPQIPGLPGVLSAFSYRIDEPADKDGAPVRYHRAGYWYSAQTGEIVANQALDGHPIALNTLTLATGLEDNEKLDRLSGEIIVRLPQETRSTRLPLNELWAGKTVDGITVTLAEVSGGTFPGYGLKVEGNIAKLVNLHGLSATDGRVAASPVDFQDAGYWTLTLPFGKGIEEVELVTASAQEVLRYPFDFVPGYPAD